MADQTIAGQPFAGAPRPSKSFGTGRVCGEPGCTTRLSRYNSGHYCYEHERLTVPRTRGKKIA